MVTTTIVYFLHTISHQNTTKCIKCFSCIKKQKITCKNNITQNSFQNCVSQVLPLHSITNS